MWKKREILAVLGVFKSRTSTLPPWRSRYFAIMIISPCMSRCVISSLSFISMVWMININYMLTVKKETWWDNLLNSPNPSLKYLNNSFRHKAKQYSHSRPIHSKSAIDSSFWRQRMIREISSFPIRLVLLGIKKILLIWKKYDHEKKIEYYKRSKQTLLK